MDLANWIVAIMSIVAGSLGIISLPIYLSYTGKNKDRSDLRNTIQRIALESVEDQDPRKIEGRAVSMLMRSKGEVEELNLEEIRDQLDLLYIAKLADGKYYENIAKIANKINKRLAEGVGERAKELLIPANVVDYFIAEWRPYENDRLLGILKLQEFGNAGSLTENVQVFKRLERMRLDLLKDIAVLLRWREMLTGDRLFRESRSTRFALRMAQSPPTAPIWGVSASEQAGRQLESSSPPGERAAQKWDS